MAKHIVASLPFWGLSALAAGSIGAPLAGVGHGEEHVQRASFAAKGINPPQAGRRSALRAGSLAENAAFTTTTKPHGKREVPGTVTVAPHTAKVQTTPLAQIADFGASQTSQAVDPPALRASVLQASDRAGKLTYQQLNTLPVSPSNAVANATSNIVAAAALPTLARDNQTIYGTSAVNAYKVYYPHIETPAPARHASDVQAYSGAPEQDKRVLKKAGSYLVYENPADGETGKEALGLLKADGAVDLKSLSRVVSRGNDQEQNNKLTEPVLQKQPLNFDGNITK